MNAGLGREAAAAGGKPGERLALVSGNAIAQLAGQGFQNLLSAAVLILITRSLAPELYGRYGFVLALSSFLALVANGGFTYIVAREIATSPPGERGSILGAALVLRAAAGLGGILVVWAAGSAAGVGTETLGLVCLSFGALSVWLVAEVYGGMLTGLDRLSVWSLASTLARAANLVLVVLALRWKLGLAGLFASTLVANLALLGGLAAVSERRFVRVNLGVSSERRSALLRESAPVGLFLVAQYGSWQAPILLLKAAETWATVGVFYGPVRLVEMFRILPAAMGSALMPTLSAAREPREHLSVIRLLVGGMLALTVPLSIVVAVFAGPIVRFAFGDSYAESARPMRLLAPLVILVGLSGAFDFVLVALSHQKERMFASLVGLASGIAIFLAVWPLGAVRAACASLLAAEGVGCLLCLRLLALEIRGLALPGVLLKPLLAGAAMAILLVTPYGRSHPFGSTVLGFAGYLVALAGLGVIPVTNPEGRALVARVARAVLRTGTVRKEAGREGVPGKDKE